MIDAFIDFCRWYWDQVCTPLRDEDWWDQIW
jgi:hypothetical protein